MIDWRAIHSGRMLIETFELPEAVAHKVRVFMQRMGLVFGSIDMIVTPEDEYVFLEVNEQGQFLWIEEFNPDFKMLDIFIQFMLQRSAAFTWDPDTCRHSIEPYRNQMKDIYDRNMKHHVQVNTLCERS